MEAPKGDFTGVLARRPLPFNLVNGLWLGDGKYIIELL
jgi:hypothetical protein